MAEIAGAAAAVTSTVLKLGNILNNEANFILGVKDGVEQLQKELRWMKSFLKDAETKMDNNSLIRNWVSDVRDLAYEAEDVIDTFLHKFGPETHTSSCPHCFSFTKNVPTTQKLGRQLEKLKAKSDEIEKWRNRYGLNADVSNSRKLDEKLKELRASAPYANNEDMVGLAETVRILKDKLANVGSGRSVISIVGMGGLGKTTLARRLYNEMRLGYFSYHGWVCVSQEYDTKVILKQVIMSMVNPDKKVLKELTTKESMEVYLRGKLAGSSFLVVIDDVWEREAWERLERAFPDDNTTKGRVIITTRYRHVAELNSHYVHELRYLNEHESWELFCKKTFRYDTNTKCPMHLELLGKEMVAKCCGLPLALVTLGGVLFTKSQIQWEWQLVRDNLWKELEKFTIHINGVLTLSFKELPDYLKLCFLYVGMFPEDSEIPIRRLKLLWEAEGFLIGCEEQEEASTEDIAQSCFNELVGRNLLQMTGEDWIESTCRVHDLLRDLAIRQAKEIQFCAFYGESQKNDLLNEPSRRRLAMHLSIQNMPGDFGDRSLRTLCLCLGEEKDFGSKLSLPVNKLLKSLHQRFHLLRVLDIYTFYRMSHLQVDELFNLRYLSLTVEQPFKLPESLGDLKELQTLSVSSWRGIVKLPKSVGKLQSLKHLLGNIRCRGGGIGKLAGLKTLEIADYKTWRDLDPAPFVNLRHLSLILHSESDSTTETPETFVSKFASLKGLQKLVLGDYGPFTIWGTSEILEIFKHCHRITHFTLLGRFSCSDLHFDAGNLQVLELKHVKFEKFSSMISKVQGLPALRALRLYVDTKNILDRTTEPVVHLACSEVGFPQLRTLHIKLIYGIRTGSHVELSVAEGGLPVLTNLHVDGHDKLIAPDRLKQLISVAP